MRSHWLALAAFILIVASGSSEAKIVHRWSFATDGKDSVGTANAVLREGAAVASGKVDLNGSGAYVELPIGATVSKLTNATIEAWATWDTAQGAWARLFDIGMGQNAYMFLTPRHGRAAEGGAENSIRFAITTNGFGEEQTVNGPAQFPTAKETHVAVTIDAEKKVARLYVDGKLVATQENFTLTPSGLGTTTNNWLGGSQFFESDPTFDGSVSEFRIYDTALSEVEIAASAKAGADTLAAAGPPMLAATSAKLLHRWSFATDASDPVGKANGVLREGAKVADGKLELDGTAGYVELPIGGTISKLGSITVEGWATWPQQQGAWARIFDFGTGQAASMYITPRNGRAEQGSAANSVRFVITNAGFQEEEQINAPEGFPTGKETHFAVTIDGEKRVGTLYIDGKPVGTNKELTLKPSVLGSTNNNWLGASQYFESDPLFRGSISEFRIYDGALTEAEIADSAKRGPDGTGTAAPAEPPRVVAAPPTPTTSPTTTTQPTATTPPTTSTQPTTQTPPTATTPPSASTAPRLLHRWSFAVDASDSVGTAKGTLEGGATIADGRVVLDGQRAHVALPIGDTMEKLTNSTFETWVKWDERQRAWLRLFDFGARAGKSMYVTPRNGGGRRGAQANTLRFTITVNGDAGEQQANSPDQFPIGADTHVALTIDADKDVAKLYVNGKLAATQENVTLSPSDLGKTTNNWIGRSQFPDPFFKGSFTEFRIYNSALTPEQVAKNFELGPDKIEPLPPARPGGEARPEAGK